MARSTSTAQATHETASGFVAVRKRKKNRSTDENPVKPQSDSESKSVSSRNVSNVASEREEQKKQKQKSEKFRSIDEEPVKLQSVSASVREEEKKQKQKSKKRHSTGEEPIKHSDSEPISISPHKVDTLTSEHEEEKKQKSKKRRSLNKEPVKLLSDSESKSVSSRILGTSVSEYEEKKQKKKKTETKRSEVEAALISSGSEKALIVSDKSNNSLETEDERNEKRKKKKRIREEAATFVVGSEENGSFVKNNSAVEKRKKKRNRKNEDIAAEVSPDSESMPICEEEATAERSKQSPSISFKQDNSETISSYGNNDSSLTGEIQNDKNRKPKKKFRLDNGSAHQQTQADSRNEREYPFGTGKDTIRGVVLDQSVKGGGPGSREEGNLCEDEGKKKKTKKKVSFEDQHMKQASDEVDADFSVTNDDETEIWGVRFTPEEDEILKQSVFKYIKERGWDEKEGLEKVLNCKQYKDAKNCWKDIKASLPNRPRVAIRFRAHLLLEEGTHLGRWSNDEEALLKSLQAKHGNSWKRISSMLGRNRSSIKEKWRTLKRGKASGKWSQKELQQLSELVHKCYRIKALMGLEKKSTDRHILKDDINWEKIADDIGSHGHGACCGKWYYSLCSSMVSDGIWANEDDFLLLKSLLESGACAEEEVEWNKLLAHRAGTLCLTRWKQMGKHLGENISRSFLDKLDILTKRYAPELLENTDDEQAIHPGCL